MAMFNGEEAMNAVTPFGEIRAEMQSPAPTNHSWPWMQLPAGSSPDAERAQESPRFRAKPVFGNSGFNHWKTPSPT